MIDKQKTKLYSGYGLCIHSDFCLPGMPEMACGVADIIITRDSSILPTAHIIRDIVQLSESAWTIAWPSIARYTIYDGVRIHVEPVGGASDQVIALPLLGPVFAMTLHLRGLVVLHGSALSIHGRAVAFLGDKGAGKSTLVAACLRAGHQLLTDDIVAISTTSGTPIQIAPSSALFKLTPETDAIIDLDWAPQRMAPHPSFDKIIRDAGQRFSVEPKALDRIYVIRRGPSVEIGHTSSSAALQALLRFSHIARFGNHIVKVGGAADQLKRSAPLADKISVLTVMEGLGAIDTAVRRIERSLLPTAEEDVQK